MDEESLAQSIQETGAVQYGEFELKHGGTSDYYINKYLFQTDPECLQEIGREVAKRVTNRKFAGVALGAVPLVAIAGVRTGNRYVIVRKEKKDHGTNNRIEGRIEESDELVVIEDVTTTGRTALQSVQALRQESATVNEVLVVVDREQGATDLLESHGVRLSSLLTAKDLVDAR